MGVLRLEVSNSKVSTEWYLNLGKQRRGCLERRFVVPNGVMVRDRCGIGEEGFYCSQNEGDQVLL